MAFARPTLTELVDRIQQDFVSRLGLAGALLRRSVVYVMARVLAGAAHMLHGHLQYLGNQLFPDVSDDEFLIRQASLFGITKTPATYAKGTATATGTNGTTVPTGTRLLRADGAVYTVDADVVIAGGTATLALTSVLAGSLQTLVVSQSFTFESPIANVNSTAVVATKTQDGSDQETTAALRVRLLARMGEPPRGGSTADYVAWAKTVSGVTRAFVAPLGMGPGSVVVRFVRDNDGSGAAIVPDSGELAAVQSYLDLMRPAHATVYVIAPTVQTVPVTTLITPNTVATRAAVTAELNDLFARKSAPGATVLLSDIQTAIRIASGVTDRVVTVPAADVTATSINHIPILGTVTFT